MATGAAPEVGEERVADTEHDQSDCGVATDPELAGRVVAHVVQTLDRLVRPMDGIREDPNQAGA
ncbi:hypothetical protein GCM10009807_01290 [Microbacterium lacus]|uniref:Uncharacterized protein n=1 Tax=Microbacterium lacus TaxID=415217 RepID=A0ABN2FXU3_9MICO